MANSSVEYSVTEETFLSHFEEKSHIYVKHYHPKPSIKKNQKYHHLIFQHGMIEYHGRHEEFIQSVIEQMRGEVIVSVMDLLGHGLSGGHRAYVDRFETYSFDMITFFELCREQLPDTYCQKRVLASHSLGGLIVLKTVVSEAYTLPFVIDKLIFINPCISPKIELPQLSVKLASNIPSLLKRIRVPLIYSAHDLSQDESKAIDFMHDHLISKSVSLKLAVETLKATEKINNLSYFFKIPSLFILSGDDVVVDNDKAKLFITGMDKKLVQVKFYPKMKHDILNETCRIDVFKEIIAYIKQ